MQNDGSLTLPTGLMQDRVSLLRRAFHEIGVKTVSRVDLTATSRVDLLRLLRRFRNSYDIIAVKCVNQNVAAVACRDRRVDVVFFDPRNGKVRFNHSLANLLRCGLELNFPSTLVKGADSAVYARISREVAIAREHRTRVVLSSGSLSAQMVRSPSEISAIASAIGLSAEQSRRGVSEVPRSIILRNFLKRSQEYVEEGVKVVTPSAR
jgi:RNase P/RNase MRP subunit p30